MPSARRPLFRLSLAAAVCTLLLLPGAPLDAFLAQTPTQTPRVDATARLWGRVVTVDGAAVEGFLRWDRNETGAADLLDGTRSVTEEGLEARREIAEASSEDRRRSVEILGYRVTWKEDEDFDTAVESGIRFGWVDRIVPDGDDVQVILRTGDTIRLGATSSDIGPGMRGLDVEGADGEINTIRWPRIGEVTLGTAPPMATPASRRLHGTLTTVSGLTFTGWIAWDADEVFESEVLDGDEGGVAFADIARIERASPGVRLTLKSGERRTLTGSNDVDRDNRGIHVSDPDLGRAQVSWEEFEALDFHEPVPTPGSSALTFSYGGPLMGRVTTESGRTWSGRVLWDLDEGFAWQLLNGSAEGVDVAIEFSRIVRIEKAQGGQGARVVLRDGRALQLEGSNDVDATNRGLLVIDASGERHFVDWAGFSTLDLETR